MKKILITFIFIFVLLCLTGCTYSNFYSYEQHYMRVEKLVKKRYINDSTQYTGYKIYPLYNENDKFQYFLIELEPFDFVYVEVVQNPIPFNAYSMYLRREGKAWSRYTYEGYDEDSHEYIKNYELDENGDKKIYNVSPFKAANVLHEKKYLLSVNSGGIKTTIVAIKSGDKYLNLISMEEFEYSPKIEEGEQPDHYVSFISKKYYNL